MLSRPYFQSRVLEEELQVKNISYVVSAGHPFWSCNEVNDMVAFLKVISAPLEADSEQLRTVLTCLDRESTPGGVLEWARNTVHHLAMFWHHQ